MLNLLSWWYSAGWANFLHRIGERLANLIDFFSIDLLFKTLFAPFRQISAGANKIIDRLVSRIVGAFVRIFIIIAGIVCIGITALISFILIIIWPLIPLAPIVGAIISIVGVTF